VLTKELDGRLVHDSRRLQSIVPPLVRELA
jgi:hypothetical protein